MYEAIRLLSIVKEAEEDTHKQLLTKLKKQ
jgi:hypothetical protein